VKSFCVAGMGLIAVAVALLPSRNTTPPGFETSAVAAVDPAPAFKAGVATKVITPEKPMWMAGYASRNKPSEGKTHDLHAKAVCLEDAAGSRLVLVTTDLIGLPRPLAVEVAAEAEKKFGIKRAELMLTASHTHCGPVLRANLIDMYGLTPEEADKVAAYTKKLKADLVEVIGAAVKNLEPATLKFGHGKAGFAMNRREATEKGVIIGKNPAGPIDHTVPVLVAEGKDGKPMAVVFGYACHNTTLSFYDWCGDYAGFAQIGVEKAFPGAVAMFWAGCGGDANPQPRGKLEQCEEHGKDLADAVASVVKGEMKPVTGKFAAKFETVTLKFESVPTKAQLAADTLSKTLAVQRRAERLLKELEVTGKIADSYPHYPVQTWNIGDQLLWVALGGEVVIDYALRLKKELPATQTLWVTAYANDVMAYIPSARVLKEGGYEADSSQVYYGMPGKWSAAIEDVIITKVKQLAGAAGELPKAPGPLSPKEERATFQVPDGFKVELVASEPDIVDPVAMCFDEKGRLFVCEMRGYPNGGVGTGMETRGKIKCLTDTDGDGYFETCVTFAEGLRFPMGLQPYKGGLLVAVAPDLLYLQDTGGNGKADKTTVLYTGFNLANIQQMVNGLQWGLDNWVYGCAGSDGGIVRSAEKPDAPAVSLRARGLRFKPDVPASLEPTSGGGQYGITPDDYQHWFTATNSQHLRQIVLPDHYLRRNPFLPVSAVTIDIPEHGAAARVYRVSPFEPWRVERTTRRAGGADAARFPGTELVPGGYITSACSPLVYTGELFPKEYYGNNLVCDPANNLVHREILKENGAIFTAVRAYPDREFFASTDTWFRPVHLTVGPDGAIYVLDFYREVIETPLSLPDDIKKQLNLESRGRGRIWRIAPKDFKPSKMPDLTKLTAAQLADELTSPNPWRRNTAQRLIVERQEKGATARIRELLPKAEGKPGRVNLLWTLHGLGELKADDLSPALADPESGVRENALRLAESFLASSPPLAAACAKLADDPVSRVRFQLAFTAGQMPPKAATAVLAHLLTQPADSWTLTAALSSAGGHEFAILGELAARPGTPLAICSRLAAMIGARGDVRSVSAALALVADGKLPPAIDAAVLDGVGQGMRNSKVSLSAWFAKPPAGAEKAVAALRERFEKAAAALRDDAAKSDARVAAAALLAYGPFDVAGPALAEALSPTTPGDVQLTAVRALATHNDPKVAELFLKNWKGYGPATRATVLDAMLARPDRVLALLAAVEKKEVAAADLSPAQVQQLKAHPNASVKTKAGAVFKQSLDADRAKVVASFGPALKLKGDPVAGKVLFKKHCSACHKLDGVGHDVGPNLLAVLGNKSGDDLLVAVFDPNREVDPRYRTYQVGTADERVLTGIVVTETPTSITLRRAEGAEDVILRANLSLFRATTLSLMPVGLEKELRHQDVADLFAYLRSASK
jgi:putative membrane-bound dehydrogenase-like protein